MPVPTPTWEYTEAKLQCGLQKIGLAMRKTDSAAWKSRSAGCSTYLTIYTAAAGQLAAAVQGKAEQVRA
jgi:hypothetical protein